MIPDWPGFGVNQAEVTWQSLTVIPVKTGIQKSRDFWIPTFVGMTAAGLGRTVSICHCPAGG